jgi:hypothetical protein
LWTSKLQEASFIHIPDGSALTGIGRIRFSNLIFDIQVEKLELIGFSVRTICSALEKKSYAQLQ